MSLNLSNTILKAVSHVAFGQITVVDGPTFGVDIDTQAGTTEYMGSWEADDTIWDDYWEPPSLKYYRYDLYEDSNLLYTTNYPIPPAYEVGTSGMIAVAYPADI